MPREQRNLVFSRGDTDETIQGVTKPASLELAASSQCADFPLPLLAAIASDSDAAIEYVGEESVNGTPTQHIRLSKTFASQRPLAFLSELTKRDVWLDAATAFPVKIAYERRESRGRTAAIRIEVLFLDWRAAGTVFYPYRIEKSWNGTPWETISIQSVSLQNGLTDNDFPIQPRAGRK